MNNLPEEASYSLSSMHELHDITNDTSFAVEMFHSKEFIRIHNSNCSLMGIRDNTNDYYIDWLNTKATVQEKQLLSISLITGSSQQLDQLFESVSFKLYHDKSDVYWWIDTFIDHMNILSEYYTTNPERLIFDPFVDHMHSIINTYGNNISTDIIPNNKKIKKKTNRKAFLKGINLFKSLFGSDMINLFLDNKSFIISGKYYNYRFKKKSSLLTYTCITNGLNIQYDLEILDIKSGILLGNLCTIFKDTPIIDQMIGIILHIQNGQEKEILNNTNVFNKTENFGSSSHYLLKNQSTPPTPSILDLEQIANMNEENNKFKTFQIKHSKSIYTDIQNRIKSKLNNLDILKLAKNPPNTFDYILDLSSVTNHEILNLT
jgi:hypothetical protein